MEKQYRLKTPEEIREDDQRRHEIFMKTNPTYIQFHTAIDKVASILADGNGHTADELQEVMVSCGYTEKGAKHRLSAVINAIDEPGFDIYRFTIINYDEYGEPIRRTMYRKAAHGDYMNRYL